MGDWDFVCALCAAPFSAASFEDEPEEDDGIDRSLLPKAAIQWLERLCVVAENEASLGVGRCYISGPGRDEMYGSVCVEPGDHTNAPEAANGTMNISVYYNYADESTGAIPVHIKCLDILKKVLKQDGYDLNADTLYASFLEAHEEGLCYLNFDYYDFNGPDDQYFCLEAEQEAFVCDPTDIHQLRDYLNNLPTVKPSDSPSPSKSNTSVSQSQDPFSALPAELILKIMIYVPREAFIPFLLASPTASRIELTNSFFLARIAGDMPWAWEVLSPPLSERTDINWRAVYTYLYTESSASRTNALPGLANRRRIWDVCSKQAAPIYKRRAKEEKKASDQGSVPEEVKARARCAHMPHVLSTAPTKAAGLTVWLPVVTGAPGAYRLVEGEKKIKLYWTARGVFSGIAFETGKQTVLFGPEQGPGVKVDECMLGLGDWIDGFEFSIGKPDAQGDDGKEESVTKPNRASASDKHENGLAIKGVIVRRLVSEPVAFGDMSGHRRLTVVQEGHTLVGLRGEASSGMISRVGLLELPELAGPQRRPAPDASVCKLMWAEQVPSTSLSCHPSEFGYWSVQETHDLVPFYPLYFGRTEDELASLTGIVVGSNLLGIAVYHDGKVSGSAGRLEQGFSKYFPIDGKGGERVIGFTLTMGALVDGFRVITNHGRQAIFGRTGMIADSVTSTAADPCVLAGLYCSYGYKAREYTLLSSVSVLKGPGSSETADFNHFVRDQCIWEPTPPPPTWHPSTPAFGPPPNNDQATFLDFSKPVKEIQGLLAAPDWVDVVELGGFVIRYADDSDVYIGLPSTIWAQLDGRRPLKELPRHQHMATSLGPMKPPELPAHVKDDDEVRKQNAGGAVWRLGGEGERIAKVVVWETGTGRIDGMQFHSETGKASLRWGKCGGESKGKIAADDRVKGVCFVLGTSRGPYHTHDPVPLGVRALVEES
ncbi:uncharacterized protein SCHCODRAFT_02618797 [Schizophyllum commune H4-8]|nr:uncharacterized protein SCHCODRAFT_02618797 [Schizophyllum commune H4-8]KAI5895214.1 hypothetical protein SCHCODRAFT_02618797 [Schizophyllum commune H4-8]